MGVSPPVDQPTDIATTALRSAGADRSDVYVTQIRRYNSDVYEDIPRGRWPQPKEWFGASAFGADKCAQTAHTLNVCRYEGAMNRKDIELDSMQNTAGSALILKRLN